MPASKPSKARASLREDDAPDLSTPEWRAKVDKVKVKRGRPKSAVTKVSQNLRLDRDVLEGASRLSQPTNEKARRRA